MVLVFFSRSSFWTFESSEKTASRAFTALSYSTTCCRNMAESMAASAVRLSTSGCWAQRLADSAVLREGIEIIEIISMTNAGSY